VLQEVYTLTSDDNELSAKLDYSIKLKKVGHEKRVSRVFQYSGPDKSTVELLQQHGQQWLRTPASCWRIDTTTWDTTTWTRRLQDPQDDAVGNCLQLKCADAQTRILYRHYCLALEKARQHLPHRSANEIAGSIYKAGMFSSMSLDKILESTKDVLAAGSRYALLESKLGEGSLGVLGTDVPETVYVLFPQPKHIS
jgi:hypothetical protein